MDDNTTKPITIAVCVTVALTVLTICFLVYQIGVDSFKDAFEEVQAVNNQVPTGMEIYENKIVDAQTVKEAFRKYCNYTGKDSEVQCILVTKAIGLESDFSVTGVSANAGVDATQELLIVEYSCSDGTSGNFKSVANFATLMNWINNSAEILAADESKSDSERLGKYFLNENASYYASIQVVGDKTLIVFKQEG